VYGVVLLQVTDSVPVASRATLSDPWFPKARVAGVTTLQWGSMVRVTLSVPVAVPA
jgi:hypothetical protein